MRVSLLIPVYGRFDLAQRCILRLAETTAGEDVEIIVGDDASPVGTAEEMMLPPGVAVFRNAVNLGFAGNCNELAKRALGDIIIFINSDAFAHHGWLPPLRRLFDSPKVGVVGPKLLFPDGRIQSVGGMFDGRKGPFHRYIGQSGEWLPAQVSCHVAWTTGAVLATRRQLFAELGGFDAATYGRAYFEDVDYCLKVRQQGLEIWYCAEAVFMHLVGQSTGGAKSYQEQLQASEQFRQNSLAFHKRWDSVIVPDVQRVEVNY